MGVNVHINPPAYPMTNLEWQVQDIIKVLDQDQACQQICLLLFHLQDKDLMDMDMHQDIKLIFYLKFNLYSFHKTYLS